MVCWHIDYRCANEKKVVNLGDILALCDSCWQLQDSKHALDFHQEPVAYVENLKKKMHWLDCSLPTPDFSDIASSVGFLECKKSRTQFSSNL